MQIRSSAPTRVSLFGGGSDISPYVNKYGGACLSMAVNLRQEIDLDTQMIGCGIPEGASMEFYKAFFNEYRYPTGFWANFNGEITGGIGSSASAAVALLGALHALTGKKTDPYKLSEEAWDIEVNKLGMFGGKQDQYAAAFGGVNLFEFGKKVKVSPIKMHDNIKNAILLFHSGSNRKSKKIQEGFKELSEIQIASLHTLKTIAKESVMCIETGDVETFGKLLRMSWECKKSSNKGVSNDSIDTLLTKAKGLGAYGGKVLGAGGGGYCIFVVDPDRQKEFIKKIGIKHVPYEIDYQGLKVDIL